MEARQSQGGSGPDLLRESLCLHLEALQDQYRNNEPTELIGSAHKSLIMFQKFQSVINGNSILGAESYICIHRDLLHGDSL